MRDQYKVLSEKYSRITENTEDTVVKTDLDTLFPKLLDATTFDEFRGYLKQVTGSKACRVFDIVDSKTGLDLWRRVIKELGPLSGGEPGDEFIVGAGSTISDLLIIALAGALGYNTATRTPGKKLSVITQVVLDQYKERFIRWRTEYEEYKVLKAAQTQHTKTHGVDLRDL